MGLKVLALDLENEEVTGLQMESWSVSGTNMASLQVEWDEFLKLPFPEYPKNKEIRKIYPEFVLWDGHVAGIVTSFLQGKRVDRKLIYVEEKINSVLDSIKPVDVKEEKEVMEFRLRKEKLDKLISIVLYPYKNE